MISVPAGADTTKSRLPGLYDTSIASTRVIQRVPTWPLSRTAWTWTVGSTVPFDMVFGPYWRMIRPEDPGELDFHV